VSTPALRTDNLCLHISGAHIVNDICMDIEQGEFVAVIGPNGAGKTSLLNLISGTARSTAGTVHLLGQDITRRSTHGRAALGLARTFQTSYLLLGLTVLENVRLMVQAETVRGLGLFRRVTRSDTTIARAHEALERVGLAGMADRTAGALSHGDRRKLELAIVIAAQAKVILLDEPMAGVNAEDVAGLAELIRDVQRTTGATVIMVEHHLHIVLGLAQRVAVMHHGAMLAFDVPDKVMADEQVQTAYVGEAL
jgi:branched-chain amino acid transport system ATP-binding protein